MLVPLWGATIVAVRELDRVPLVIAGVVLATAFGMTPLVADRVAARAGIPRVSSRRAVLAAAVALTCVLTVLSTWVVNDVYAGFRSSVPAEGGLDRRLISLSGMGRADYWAVAWDEYTSHPLLGTGAGTFELAWNRERPTNFGARDAHNVYLEALAELGPIGLALLCVVLVIPLARLRRAPRSPLVAAGASAYVAVWLHASVDWDWEMPAVTIAALVCGCALVISSPGRRQSIRGTGRAALVGACVLLVAVAFVGAVGNAALARASGALARGDVVQAERAARRATTWAPWASEGWRLLGEARVRRGRIRSGRAALVTAVERDPHDWLPWSRLFEVSRGPERLRALDMVARLNPRSIGLRPVTDMSGGSGN
jgi:hypothetical protein